jgi:hypothetical protein
MRVRPEPAAMLTVISQRSNPSAEILGTSQVFVAPQGRSR